MPQVYKNEVVYDFPPAHTITWLLRKYPNPYATHVFSVDTVGRTIDPETGILRSERIIGVQQGAPKWVAKLFQLPETAYVREVVFINPDDSSATMMSQNLNYAEYINCLEHITYTPTDGNKTLFRQRALMVSGFPTGLIARRIEKASVDRFKSNASAGKQGFDWVLQKGLERE